MSKFQVHVAGPDDVHEFDDELKALREANKINRWWLGNRATADDPANEPLCVATVWTDEMLPGYMQRVTEKNSG